MRIGRSMCAQCDQLIAQCTSLQLIHLTIATDATIRVSGINGRIPNRHYSLRDEVASDAEGHAERCRERQSKAEQVRAGQSKAEQVRAGQSKIKAIGKAKQGRARQSKAEQGRARQSKAEQGRPCRRGQWRCRRCSSDKTCIRRGVHGRSAYGVA